jgi:oligopeptide transport system ATP-binding protein
VRDLRVSLRTAQGRAEVIHGVSFDLHAGETLGIVGESGSGKSLTTLSLLGLVPRTARVGGQAVFEGADLLTMAERRLRRIRGGQIGVIFQDPSNSLTPVFTVGAQIAEAIQLHDRTTSRAQAFTTSVELLRLVGVGNPELRAKQYPHELSGGMRQRAMIAMAIANRPQVIIADEPTTALDVTVQAQVMDVLRAAQRETGAAVILITHDLGLVAESADRIVVMYAGRIVESGPAKDILAHPCHPYSRGLLECLPSVETAGQALTTIPGEPADPAARAPGCSFADRCWLSRGRAQCRAVTPELVVVGAGEHRTACHFHDEMAPEPSEVG